MGKSIYGVRVHRPSHWSAGIADQLDKSDKMASGKCDLIFMVVT